MASVGLPYRPEASALGSIFLHGTNNVLRSSNCKSSRIAAWYAKRAKFLKPCTDASSNLPECGYTPMARYLTYRESLRDIEVNLRAQARRLYHMGFRCQTISRNTLANANATRPWQIYADFAQHLIGMARPLYAKEPFGLELDATVYAFDATTIDLCLSVYAWAPFRSTKAAIKLHTLLDLQRQYPQLHSHHRRQDPRGQCAGRSGDRGRSVLPAGSGVSGFRPAVCDSPGPGLLCDPRQEQHQVQAALLASGRSDQYHMCLCDQTGVLTVYLFQQGLPDDVAPGGGQGRHGQAN